MACVIEFALRALGVEKAIARNIAKTTARVVIRVFIYSPLLSNRTAGAVFDKNPEIFFRMLRASKENKELQEVDDDSRSPKLPDQAGKAR